MSELRFTAFECFHAKTYYTNVCGRKANGKSVRVERFGATLPVGTAVEVGSATTMAGRNGKNNARTNGAISLHDEMLRDMIEKDSQKHEYFKSIVTKRSWVHDRSEPKSTTGVGGWRTVSNITDHRGSYAIAHNLGCAYLPEEETSPPSDSRRALMSRSVFLMARSNPAAAATTSCEDDIVAKIMSDDASAARLNQYRLLMSLTAVTLMAIQDVNVLQPDL